MTQSLSREGIIHAFSDIGRLLENPDDETKTALSRAHHENQWFEPSVYNRAIEHWAQLLKEEKLLRFSTAYPFASKSKRVGIVMAGNIPMVGFHDLLCVLLAGHKASVKLSSNDSVFMAFLIKRLQKSLALNSIEENDRLKMDLDAVIATGSNNSNRYFEFYFKNMPRLLRANRKSLAVLNGEESQTDLENLGTDVFSYFGLGCRNVSLVFIPEDYQISKMLDAFYPFSFVIDHHKYNNNYTYHRALFLMNKQEHLDTGYLLVKEDRNLHAPLSTLFYSTYRNRQELHEFINEHQQGIQCIVGNYNSEYTIPFGSTQAPDLEDYADHKNTLQFLSDL